jgi:hypothetical protein
MHWLLHYTVFCEPKELLNTSNAGTRLNPRARLLQPERNNFTSDSIQRRTGLSLCMCYRFAVFPSPPPTCVIVTVIQAQSYVASTVLMFCLAQGQRAVSPHSASAARSYIIWRSNCTVAFWTHCISYFNLFLCVAVFQTSLYACVYYRRKVSNFFFCLTAYIRCLTVLMSAASVLLLSFVTLTIDLLMGLKSTLLCGYSWLSTGLLINQLTFSITSSPTLVNSQPPI